MHSPPRRRGVDTGQILAQSQLEIHPDDDEESLSERVKILEHKLYPEVIDAYAANTLWCRLKSRFFVNEELIMETFSPNCDR